MEAWMSSNPRAALIASKVAVSSSPQGGVGGGLGGGGIAHEAGALALRHPAHGVEARADQARHLAPVSGRARAALHARQAVADGRRGRIKRLGRRLQVVGDQACGGGDGLLKRRRIDAGGGEHLAGDVFARRGEGVGHGLLQPVGGGVQHGKLLSATPGRRGRAALEWPRQDGWVPSPSMGEGQGGSGCAALSGSAIEALSFGQPSDGGASTPSLPFPHQGGRKATVRWAG